ncbi:MAG: hypothetical protein ACHQ1G_05380 [Planctomycetota bacterium]
MRRLFCLSLLLPLATAAPDENEEARRLRPDHAPVPFTADQIREACREGRTDTYRIELRNEKPSKHTAKFLKCDREGAEVEATNTLKDGTVTTTKERQAWVDFQTQASFPAIDTKITEETIEVPAGKFECWLYTVQKKEGDPAVVRLYFAKKLPGHPVKITSEEKGKAIFTMTLLEHKDGGKKEEEKAPEKGKE